MSSEPNWEGRTIARIRDAKSGQAVGFVILTDLGEVVRLWVLPEPTSVTIEAILGDVLAP